LGCFNFAALLRGDFDGKVDDFLCVHISCYEASRFDGENPQVSKSLQITLVV
jgi:hypothetical protein